MNIENVLLTSGLSSFNRIFNFMQGLYIKNVAEANKYKSVDSEDSYEKYELAYEGVDIITDYTYTTHDLRTYGFSDDESERYIVPSEMLKITSDNRVKKMLADYRKKRLTEYIEYNGYYKTFLGKPSSADEYVTVMNDDAVLPTDPPTIYLHDVTLAKYPETYNRLFIKGEFSKITAELSYPYLKFIESPLSPYFIHNALQFEILYYPDNFLESAELKYYFDCYNQVRCEILEVDYIDGFDDNYYEYSLLMLSFLLYGTYTRYNNKMMERYALRNYTIDEIYDILDSNGLSKLKSLDTNLLKKVVNRLPDLNAVKGTNKVIDIIFDIVADKSLAIKRYYLNKEYVIDAQGNLDIDPTKKYEDSVNLTFAEKAIKVGSDAITTSNMHTDYHEFVADDDTWGGVLEIKETEAKRAIKEKLRRRLLSMDFSSLVTKYISVSKIVNMYDKVSYSSNLLALFYQINEARGNFMLSDVISFEGMDFSPIALYSAWCWAFAAYNGVTNPSYIVQSANTLTDIIMLRNVDGLAKSVTETGAIKISLGNGYDRKLSYYFTNAELQDLLVNFNCDITQSISKILSQYEANAAIIAKIKAKISASSTVEDYNIWTTLLKANIISKRLSSLFSGESQYDEYIFKYAKNFYNYVAPIINDTTNANRANLKTLIDKINVAYSSYITDRTSGMTSVYITEDAIIGGENLNDITTLLNEFMSIFTQIYKTDFHVGYDDESVNNLKLLYTEFVSTFISDDVDLETLTYFLKEDTHYLSDVVFSLGLTHTMDESLIEDNSFTIKLLYSIIYELLYEEFFGSVELSYESRLDESYHPLDDNVTLRYVTKEITN